jgi:hypothetical protein
VNADVASLHEIPVAETVDNARKQQGLAERSPYVLRSAGASAKTGEAPTAMKFCSSVPFGYRTL